MKHLLIRWSAWLLTFTVWGQTTILDNFDRADSTTLGNGWTEVESGPPSTIQIAGQRVKCFTGGSGGREWFYQDISAHYNPTYQNAGNVTYTWGFNMRQSRTNPSGFNTNNYGILFVLGSSSSTYTSGQGYGVALGNSGSTDPIRLVRFNGGFDANSDLTNLISYGDFGNEYLTVRVDLDVTARKWYLYVHDSTDFRDPATLSSVHLRDSIIDSTYTAIALPYLGGFYNHASSGSQSADFDHFIIPHFPPSGSSMLTSGPLSEPSTIASTATTPATAVWSFTVVDDSLNPSVDADPTQITDLSIVGGPADQFATWNGVIAGAYLISGTDTITGSVAPAGRTITFSGIPTGVGEAGYIPDNGRKTYALHIWLSAAMPDGMQDTVEGTHFQFRVSASNITVGGGSTFDPSTNVISNATRNAIAVTATALAFRIQPQTAWRGQTLSTFTVGGVDIYGNLDEDYNGAINITPDFACPSLNGTTPRMASNGIATFDDIVFYGTVGNGRLVASASGLANDTSQPFTIKDTASAYHTLAGWDFSDSTRQFQPDIYTPHNANARLDVVGAVWDGAGGAIFGRICGSARTAQWDGGAGTKYFVTRVATQGYFQIKVTSHQRSSSGGPRDFIVQYSFDSLNWTTVGNVDTVRNNCTDGFFEATLPSVCSDTDTLYIRWLMNSNIRSDGTGNVIAAGANNIYDVSIQGLYYSEARDKYYRTRQSGNFYTGCTWEWSSDSITWTVADLPPDFTSRTIHIRSGHIVELANDSLWIDQVVIDSGATLITQGKFFLQDGPGTDLTVKGTLEVANTSTSPPQWENGATWQLDTGATFVKSSSSSAADWRDHYHNGMASIAYPAQWIIRKNTSADPTFTTTNSYYPDLIFDNLLTSVWHPTSSSSKFTGSTSTALIKGDLKLQNGVVITHANTATSPIQVMNNLYVGGSDTLMVEGTGFEVHGNLIIEGVFDSWFQNAQRRLLYTRGDSVIVSGIARFHEWRTAHPDTLIVQGNVWIDSLLAIDSGIVKTTPTDTIFLDSAAQLNEQPQHFVYGTVRVAEDITTSGTWYDFAGIGVEIQFSGVSPGHTIVVRRTDTFAYVGNYRGIRRIVNIHPTVNSGLDATLRFHYNDHPMAGEIDTLNEGRLDLFRYDGMAWSNQNATLDSAANILIKNSINAFSLWTAADMDYPLPVELISFDAVLHFDRTVRLKWTTASEANVMRFVVERSTDGHHFTPVGNVRATGWSTVLQSYIWDDVVPPPHKVVYYRLRLEDFDGTIAYSDIRTVNLMMSTHELPPIFRITSNYIRITLPGNRFTYRLYDASGRIVRHGMGTDHLSIPIEALPTGYYLLHLYFPEGAARHFHIIKP